jgi:hypothetical protein
MVRDTEYPGYHALLISGFSIRNYSGDLSPEHFAPLFWPDFDDEADGESIINLVRFSPEHLGD